MDGTLMYNPDDFDFDEWDLRNTERMRREVEAMCEPPPPPPPPKNVKRETDPDRRKGSSRRNRRT